MPWNPQLYNQSPQRTSPFHDLLQTIDVQPHMTVIDLGCGDGQLTLELAEYLSADAVVAVDQSPEMLEAARKTLSSINADVIQADIHEFTTQQALNGSFDLVVSNAALQWLPDHEQLIPDVLGLVKAGGQIAVQMPSNLDHQAHMLLGELSHQEPFSVFTQGYVRPSHVLRVDHYADLLFEHHFTDIVAIEKVYCHELADAKHLVEWMVGTGMIPYLERLPADYHQPFKDTFAAALEKLMPSSPILYAQKRILLAGRKPTSL